MEKINIDIATLVNPHFDRLWNTECPYVIAKGGRGSFKSSVISLWLVWNMFLQTEQGHRANVICIRENQAYLRDSVYEQVLWAMDMLHLDSEFKSFKSPLKIEHIKTGSAFYFYGADDPRKLKSNKIQDVISVWYEEAANVKSAEVFDQANPTFIRNKSPYVNDVKVFYSYNPPKNPYDWINNWVENKKTDDQYLVDHSTYLDDELGFTTKQTMLLINSYKENDYDYYRYLYLGEAVGLGTNVYNMDMFHPLKEIPNDDPITQVAYALDSGHAQSATTVLLLGITAKKNVILLDTYYYSPAGQAVKLAPSELSIKIHNFIQSQGDKSWGRKPIVKRTIDSAEAALRNQYFKDYRIGWHPVAKKKNTTMIDSVYSLVASGRFYYLENENNQVFIEQHRNYRWDEKTVETDDPKVIKVDDHTVDAFKYFVLDNARLLGLKV